MAKIRGQSGQRQKGWSKTQKIPVFSAHEEVPHSGIAHRPRLENTSRQAVGCNKAAAAAAATDESDAPIPTVAHFDDEGVTFFHCGNEACPASLQCRQPSGFPAASAGKLYHPAVYDVRATVLGARL